MNDATKKQVKHLKTAKREIRKSLRGLRENDERLYTLLQINLAIDVVIKDLKNQ